MTFIEKILITGQLIKRYKRFFVDVKIGSNTKILPYVHIMSNTTIGENNIIHQGSVLGGAPQDLKFKNEYSELIIGDDNTIRENCTLNRGTEASGKTIIGSNCLFTAFVNGLILVPKPPDKIIPFSIIS